MIVRCRRTGSGFASSSVWRASLAPGPFLLLADYHTNFNGKRVR